MSLLERLIALLAAILLLTTLVRWISHGNAQRLGILAKKRPPQFDGRK